MTLICLNYNLVNPVKQKVEILIISGPLVQPIISFGPRRELTEKPSYRLVYFYVM